MEQGQKQKTVVFVCTGNTCRSPMAEAVFRSEIKRRQVDAVAYSAGISARGGDTENINEKSVSVLLENGLSVENFHARRLDADTLAEASCIVCMTDEQRDLLMELRWEVLRKVGIEEIENNVLSFSDVCGYEIPDPYGGDMELYRKTFELINQAMPPLFDRLFPAPTPPKKKRGRPRKNPEGTTTPRKKRAKKACEKNTEHGGETSCKGETL